MSLSHWVGNPSGPVRKFFGAELPGVKEVRAAYLGALPDLPVRVPKAPEGVRPAWSTLGAAIDHRLRYSLAAPSRRTGAVEAGVAVMANPSNGLPRATANALLTAGKDLLRELDRLARHHEPWDRGRAMLLPAPVEEEFARACYVATWYEEVFRSGRLSPNIPLGAAGPGTTLKDLLAAVPGYAVEDLFALQALAATPSPGPTGSTGLAALRAGTRPGQVVDGPVFDGSAAIGGADADVIADGLLLDVKTVTDPRQVPKLGNVLQLAGYVLLDYSDEYRIDRVGWYVTRSGWLVTWPLPHFLTMLGATRPLPELRARFADVVRRLPG